MSSRMQRRTVHIVTSTNHLATRRTGEIAVRTQESALETVAIARWIPVGPAVRKATARPRRLAGGAIHLTLRVAWATAGPSSRGARPEAAWVMLPPRVVLLPPAR